MEKIIRILRWPLIVLRTPKGWTGPEHWKDQQIEGTFHAHQVPLTKVKERCRAIKIAGRMVA